MMNETKQRFYARCLEIHDLQEIQQLLEWDQQVIMPRKGAEQRANQQAALAALAHRRLADPAFGELLSGVEDGAAGDEDLAADAREARRAYDRAVKIPEALVAERAKACALAQVAWEEAKPRDDFASFEPHLAKVLDLTRRVAEAVGTENRYDALLDEYEPGMTEAELKVLFSDLRGRLVRLMDKLLGASRRPSQEVLRRHYPAAGQEAFGIRVAKDMGYDFDAGRLDRSVHPFTSGTFGDVRITTRYDERYLSTALFGTLHEAGHALYEQGLDPERYRNPAGAYCSLGVHESQSRFWENLIGRSMPFWRHYLPVLKERFPGVLDGESVEGFYGAVNVCQPSLIRVEADEVTYNLHIILRFELESALVSGTLRTKDLPGAWNEKTKAILGIVPPSDQTGVLQDIHWSAGLFGYFPTYALGNLYAAQFMEALRADLPDLDARLSGGDLLPVKAWLNARVHRQGRKYLPQDLCLRITGRHLSADASMAYLSAKFGEVYGI
jgi:carboxypeptidase Taq